MLGERTKVPNEMSTYRQDLYAIRATSISSSLGRIQINLFSSELFEGSEVNQNAFILPTRHAKKVSNRLIIGGVGNVTQNEGMCNVIFINVILTVGLNVLCHTFIVSVLQFSYISATFPTDLRVLNDSQIDSRSVNGHIKSS